MKPTTVFVPQPEGRPALLGMLGRVPLMRCTLEEEAPTVPIRVYGCIWEKGDKYFYCRPSFLYQ